MLNCQTKKDVYPLPRIAGLLDKLAMAKYISVIDLASGYHQITMAPEDIEKAAFVTRYGLMNTLCCYWGCEMPPVHFNT